MSAMIMRAPEPLERVQAMVCEFCWLNIFNTENFERLGCLEDEEFTYHVAKKDLESGTDSGCRWCSRLYSLLTRNCSPPISEPIKRYTITLAACIRDVFTPSGSNLFKVVYGSDSDNFSYLAYLCLFTEDDNFAAHLVTARNVETDLSPSSTSTQILRWVKECTLHGCCPEQVDSPLPTRVIEVATPKILHTKGAFGNFAALSYCWGTGSQTQLRSHTIEALTQHLELNELPQTIKDAIIVTRSLSIPYLWVDALCIIQDNQEDKLQEIGLMARVYSMAHVTILASSAADAADGFLQQRSPDQSQSIQIPFRISLNQFGSVAARTNEPPRASIRQDNPLGQRAWVLQEQMMASRLLLYTPFTLEWRCAASMMSLGRALNVDFKNWPMPKLVSQLGESQKEALEEWCMIIVDYSRRAMAVQSDKLPAIAALAERFAPVLGKYYAGIWQYDPIQQLGWMVPYWKPSRRSDIYRAPSWSWASMDSEVNFWNLGEPCCTLVSAESVPKNEYVPFGEVVRAATTLCGNILVGFSTRPDNRNSTFTYAKSHADDPPLRRFYASYFHGGPIQVSEAPIQLDIDDARRTHFPQCVLLLALHKRSWTSPDLPKSYDRYRSERAHHDLPPNYNGLILVPAGSGTVRRIGTFENLFQDEVKDFVDQEIRIV